MSGSVTKESISGYILIKPRNISSGETRFVVPFQPILDSTSIELSSILQDLHNAINTGPAEVRAQNFEIWLYRSRATRVANL